MNANPNQTDALDQSGGELLNKLRNRSIANKFKMALFGTIGGAALFALFSAVAVAATAPSWAFIGAMVLCGVGCTYFGQRAAFEALDSEQELQAIKIAKCAGKSESPCLAVAVEQETEKARRADNRTWLQVVTGQADKLQQADKQEAVR